ncbi:hypothetical protein AAFF_G00359360 [Aldrovandia affinis]|uniref:Uncharacterized protein n=1 Tax=Aldrovandia affinis TaxID=143900 RepID=A0AAD7WNB9_9TELE|nr:hypothetical protein AAFF_G00359360 [Aldrovandia affinis]
MSFMPRARPTSRSGGAVPPEAGGRSRPLRFPAEGTERSGAWAVCVHVDRSYAEDRAPKPALSPRTGRDAVLSRVPTPNLLPPGRRRFKDWNPPASACTIRRQSCVLEFRSKVLNMNSHA